MNKLEQFLGAIVFIFFLIVVSPITEKEILLQFKGNISGDPQNYLNSWEITKTPCRDFAGVFCNPAGNVVKIKLWNTSLAGILSPALSELKSLRTISMFGNRFSGNIPPEYGDIQTLWKINLSSNALSGSIPDFLGDLPNIRFLDLSKNGYNGEIPSTLFTNCNKTKYISLSHNNLSGSIPVSVSNCVNLQGFDLSFNAISGGLPSEICEIPGLLYLSLRNNVLTGNVQNQLSLCHSLEHLDIGSNSFTGLAPFGLLQLNNLTQFNVSYNGFNGEIPEIETCGEKLQYLDASGNGLSGEIPLSIRNCHGLKLVDLGFNSLIGKIPVEITDLKELLVIRLGNNLIDGLIPEELGNIEFLQILDLHNLNLKGEIPNNISSCRFLLELDVSGNALQGEIPQTFYNLSNLIILDLHKNHLSGNIPSNLANLTRTQVLDLSENSFSGSIPPSLGNLTKLTHFNLSYNNLTGEIPSLPIIQQFNFTAYFHNPGLCGAPLDLSCTGGNHKPNEMRKAKLSVTAIVAIIAAFVILVGVCLISLVNMKSRGREREGALVLESTPTGSTDSNVIIGKLVLFSKSLPSRYEDWEAGTKALLDKECLVGGGSIGSVYRANFEGDIAIAVKKLETLGRIRNQEEFEQEIGMLGNIKHPNLVAFQGYYWSSSMQLILSEFVPNGNLYDNLHEIREPGLDWSMRFRVALGIAKGIMYLHHDCKPRVLHLNIKSTNILLGENFEAKLSDFGLGKLLPLLDNNNGLIGYHNAVGYVAPELAQSLRQSEKCDVYSFGVILLELVSGRKPVDSPGSSSEVVILRDYVREVIESGDASDCFDTSLRGFVENELIQVLKLGLVCTSDSPLKRPSMAEAVQVLESIRYDT